MKGERCPDCGTVIGVRRHMEGCEYSKRAVPAESHAPLHVTSQGALKIIAQKVDYWQRCERALLEIVAIESLSEENRVSIIAQSALGLPLRNQTEEEGR